MCHGTLPPPKNYQISSLLCRMVALGHNERYLEWKPFSYTVTKCLAGRRAVGNNRGTKPLSGRVILGVLESVYCIIGWLGFASLVWCKREGKAHPLGIWLILTTMDYCLLHRITKTAWISYKLEPWIVCILVPSS